MKYLFILPFLLSSYLNFGQNQKMLKQFLTVENGLSHNEVTAIILYCWIHVFKIQQPQILKS